VEQSEKTLAPARWAVGWPGVSSGTKVAFPRFRDLLSNRTSFHVEQREKIYALPRWAVGRPCVPRETKLALPRFRDLVFQPRFVPRGTAGESFAPLGGLAAAHVFHGKQKSRSALSKLVAQSNVVPRGTARVSPNPKNQESLIRLAIVSPARRVVDRHFIRRRDRPIRWRISSDLEINRRFT
jgi:hypothetical protein